MSKRVKQKPTFSIFFLIKLREKWEIINIQNWWLHVMQKTIASHLSIGLSMMGEFVVFFFFFFGYLFVYSKTFKQIPNWINMKEQNCYNNNCYKYTSYHFASLKCPANKLNSTRAKRIIISFSSHTESRTHKWWIENILWFCFSFFVVCRALLLFNRILWIFSSS